MNILDSLEGEISIISTEIMKKFPNLRDIIHECQESSQQLKQLSSVQNQHDRILPFIKLLQRICETKNSKILNAAVIIIQKLQTAQLLNKDDIIPIFKFFQRCQEIIEEQTVQIKVISTALHLISIKTISVIDQCQFLSVLNLMVSYYPNDNIIISKSSIQGILQLFSIFEEKSHQTTEKQMEFTLQLFDIFFKLIIENKSDELTFTLTHKTKSLCDDIMVIMIKSAKHLLIKSDKLKNFVCDKIISSMQKLDNVQKIRRIRLIDKFDLIINLKQIYTDSSGTVKYIVHQGFLQLLKDSQLVLRLQLAQIINNNKIETFLEFFYRIISDGLKVIQKMQESNTAQIPKLCNFFEQQTLEETDLGVLLSINPMPKTILIGQIIQLHSLICSQIAEIAINLKSYKAILEKQGTLSIIGDQKQILQSNYDEDEEVTTALEQNVPILSVEQRFFQKMIDLIWKPSIKLQKSLQKLDQDSNNLMMILETNIKWIHLTAVNKHQNSFEQFVRILAMQTSPTNLSDNEKWLISFNYLVQVIRQYKHLLSATTWNYVFQSFQRIEQVVARQEHKIKEKIFIINQLFEETKTYDVDILIQILDALNQLTLQVIEKIQVNDKKPVDSIFKQFGQERLVQVVTINWNRNILQFIFQQIFILQYIFQYYKYYNKQIIIYILFYLGAHKFWQMISAHMICVAGSRIPEMRLLAISNIKEIIVSGFLYFTQRQQSKDSESNEWDHSWSKLLLQPLKEMVCSTYDEVMESALQIVYELVKIELDKEEVYRILQILEQFGKNNENNDLNKIQKKNYYYRIFLSINCLDEIIQYENEDTFDQQWLIIIQELLIKFKPIAKTNKEIYQKLINIVFRITNTPADHLFIDTIKEVCSKYDETQFTGILTLVKLTKSHYQQLIPLLLECVQSILSTYIKTEMDQISIMMQTPRFNTIPDTPKFQQQSNSHNHAPVYIQFKQNYEVVKYLINQLADLYSTVDDTESFFTIFKSIIIVNSIELKQELIYKFQKVIFKHSKQEDLQLVLNTLIELIHQEQDSQFYDLRFIPILSEYFQYFLKFQSLFERTLQLHKLIILYAQKHGTNNKKPLQQTLDALEQQFNTLPIDFQCKWLSFLADNLKELSNQQDSEMFLQMITNSFQRLLQAKDITQFKQEIKKYITILTKLIFKCQCLENRNIHLQELLISKLQQILSTFLTEVNNETFKDIVWPFIDPNKENLILQQSEESSPDRKKFEQTKQQLQQLQRDYTWLNFLVKEISPKVDNDEKLSLIAEIITQYYNEQTEIFQIQHSSLITSQNLLIFFYELLLNDSKIIGKLQEEIKPSLIEGTKLLLQQFVDLELRSELKYSWQECVYNTVKILDFFIQQQNQDQLNQCYPLFVRLIMSNENEIKTKLCKIFETFQQYIPK